MLKICAPSAMTLVLAGLAMAQGEVDIVNNGARDPRVPDRAAAVNSRLGLRDSRIITMEVDRTPGRRIRTTLKINEAESIMSLEPHSIRTPGFRLRAQLADGSLVDMEPGPVRTMRGEIEGMPGSHAAASMMSDGLHGSVVMPDGERWWFQPLADQLRDAADNEYALYRNADVISRPGACGNVEAQPAAGGAGPPAAPGPVSGPVMCARLACDADVEYFLSHGADVQMVQDQIERVTNQMDLQYVSEVGIDHVISQIIVRTAEPDPYTADAAVPLVTQFRAHWLANHGDVPRDVAQLFTGRPISAGTGGYIGYAFSIGAVCTNGAYCVSQSDWGDCCGSLACATDLSAHELGHLWGAVHCTDWCFSTMYPNILCSNTFTGSDPSSIGSITAYRQSASCLTACTPALIPFFDTFSGPAIDAARWTNPVSCGISNLSLNAPSPPLTLNLRGHVNGGATITSAAMNTTGAAVVQLSYWCQQGGAGDDPDPGADLVTEYLDIGGQWIEVDRQSGAEPPQDVFAPRTINLPASASHAQFRVRFRNLSWTMFSDDWFIDDVRVIKSPVNNHCALAAVVPAGTTQYSTELATTDGPDETVAGGCGVGEIHNDIWYRYLPSCVPGTVTISLCGATFDSRVAAYIGCPSTPGALVCDDNSCGDDAQISLHIAQAQVLRIRIGGATAVHGTGNLVITCVPDPPSCPADINGNSTVDIDDLLDVIGHWGWAGAPGSVDADCFPIGTGDGVVNIDDLLLIIGAWGPC